MLDAIGRIDRSVNGLSLQMFSGNEQVVDAVIRNLIVIGEAAGHIPSEVVERHSEIPWAAIRGMRNAPVHDYIHISLETILSTCQDDLPSLSWQLKALLAEERQ